MASSSRTSPSASPVLCASFNQDNSWFSVGTKDGFKLFDARTGRLCFERAVGAFNIVEMLFSTNLLAIVGAGEQPSLSPRKLCLFNTLTGSALRELNFLTSIVAVRLNRKRLIVVLRDKTYIYDLNSLVILETIDTVPNNKGLCAFSPGSESCYLALPASTTKGSVLIYNTVALQSVCQIDAHRSPLVAMIFSSSGTYLATASQQGTIIRVHLVSQATESYSFRRGTYPSTIYSLSFGPCADVPEVLVATSSSGSLHAFLLGPAIKQSCVLFQQIDAHRSPLVAMIFSSSGTYLATASQQGTIIRVHLVSQATESYSFRRGTYPSTIYSLSFGPCADVPEVLVATSSSGSLHAFLLGPAIKQRRKPNRVIGSLIPDTLSDAFDHAYHHILHNVVPACVKSHVRIHSIDNISSAPEVSGFRASIFIITRNGYFREYSLNVTKSNECSWSLEREVNLLDTVSNDPN
ncbi:hypothetical protein C4D60_Mb09t12230 [Musa balbisiana]|uniref:Autophagy-related protein 18b n=1 Tax=Musa balbisiana TaxID=52838 RepID=A0A4S8IFW5_MUSBA|nr:hypothetical protein C4D60_Mb09t12230 [Musa balbisiana]